MTDTNLDRAAQMAGVSKYYGKKADPLAVSSIRAHAATLDELDAAKAELEAFKREVSDAVDEYIANDRPDNWLGFDHLAIPKPDPLIEAMNEWWDADGYANIDTFRAALAKHGLKLERIEHE